MEGNNALKDYTEKWWIKIRLFYNIKSELMGMLYKMHFKKGENILN